MAEVAELFLLPLEEEEEEEEIDLQETLDPGPYWSSAFEETLVPVFSSDLCPMPSDPDESDPESNPEESYYLDEDQVTLANDLFDRCPPPETLDSTDFRVLDGVEDMGFDYLGLGLGLGFERQEEEDDEADGFFGSSDPPMDQPLNGEGLRVVGFESDSDSEEDPVVDIGSNSGSSNSQDLGLPLCWNCLLIEDDRRDPDGEFEWEEVDGHLDEREVLSMMVGATTDEERSRSLEPEEEEDGRNVEWEVLLAVNNLGRVPLMEEPEEDEDFINPSEYEILFGQFVDHDISVRGSPPAAKLVVENLPSVLLTEEDVAKNNTLCAVCKDDIPLEERAKQLPCSHHYHGECILPWLGIRNTCPVCRYELPTDDPEYESWRARRRASGGGGAGPTEESPVRYDFEIFPEA